MFEGLCPWTPQGGLQHTPDPQVIIKLNLYYQNGPQLKCLDKALLTYMIVNLKNCQLTKSCAVRILAWFHISHGLTWNQLRPSRTTEVLFYLNEFLLIIGCLCLFPWESTLGNSVKIKLTEIKVITEIYQ